MGYLTSATLNVGGLIPMSIIDDLYPGNTYLIYKCERTGLIYKKYAGDTGTVNIYSIDGSAELDVFTNYSIKDKAEKFADSCEAWSDYILEEDE
jgi:hypothetical protein